MPTYDSGPSLVLMRLTQKWERHFKNKGVSFSKTFKLSRKYALKELRQLNGISNT